MKEINAIEGDLTVTDGNFAVLVSRFNGFIVESLLAGALDHLRRSGVGDDPIATHPRVGLIACVRTLPGFNGRRKLVVHESVGVRRLGIDVRAAPRFHRDLVITRAMFLTGRSLLRNRFRLAGRFAAFQLTEDLVEHFVCVFRSVHRRVD